jgi:hypothetical protein
MMALAIIARPSGMYFLVIYLLVLAYLAWNQFGRRIILYFSLPFPLMLLALCSYNYFTIDSFGISSFGAASIGGATILYWEPDPSFPPFVNDALARLPAAYRKAGITPENLETFRTSWDAPALYEILTRSYNPVAVADGWAYGSKFGDGTYLANRKYIMQVSTMAIRKHPDLYAKFVWTNCFFFFYKTIQYKYDFYNHLEFRASKNFAATDRGYDVEYAREYMNPKPPQLVKIDGVGDDARITLIPSRLGRWHRAVQSWQWAIFQNTLWTWVYVSVLVLSAARFIASRGRHLGSFLLLILALIALGSCLVICLVELGIERYSYPTQFIYYLSLALLPLLWGTTGPRRIPEGAKL